VSKIIFTKNGFEKLKNDYEGLVESRPFVVADLKKAREMGDLSENGYYRAAKFKLSDIDRNIRRCSYLIKSAQVVSSSQKDFVGIGSRVKLIIGNSEKNYQIVGEYEANPGDGKISHLSPIGKALIGKRSGEIVKIESPSGQTEISIKQIL